VTPELESFGALMSVEAAASLTFSAALEVS